jgi:hypothetical protein
MLAAERDHLGEDAETQAKHARARIPLDEFGRSVLLRKRTRAKAARPINMVILLMPGCTPSGMR